MDGSSLTKREIEAVDVVDGLFMSCTTMQVQYSSFKKYSQRFESFRNWPSDKPQKAYLAMAGFFFKDSPDITQCFQCGELLNDWKKNDIPMEEHYKFAKHCPYIKSLRKQLKIDK
ncbi:hypothetical protein Ahia01_000138900 [Argonauta hians]